MRWSPEKRSTTPLFRFFLRFPMVFSNCPMVLKLAHGFLKLPHGSLKFYQIFPRVFLRPPWPPRRVTWTPRAARCGCWAAGCGTSPRPRKSSQGTWRPVAMSLGGSYGDIIWLGWKNGIWYSNDCSGKGDIGDYGIIGMTWLGIYSEILVGFWWFSIAIRFSWWGCHGDIVGL